MLAGTLLLTLARSEHMSLTDALDATHPIPQHTRLQAVLAATRSVAAGEAHSLFRSRDEVVNVLVPALLRAGEELGDAVAELLSEILERVADPGEMSQRLLQRAEAEVQALLHEGRRHHTNLQQPQAERLVTLLALMLGDDGRQTCRVAANMLCERRGLVGELLHCVGRDGDLAVVASQTFLQIVRLNGAAPSAVLQRCDIPAHRLVALLPGARSGARARPAGGNAAGGHALPMLQLLGELARDDEIAAALSGAPQFFAAVKPPLLSGVVPLQLAVVELLHTIQRAVPRATSALCDEDLLAFCLEVGHGNTPAQQMAEAEQEELKARLGLAVRRLLIPLLRWPQHGAPAVATRLLASLGSRVHGVHGGRRAESAIEHALLELECVLALLEWYAPAAPAETSRLAAFCCHLAPLLLAGWRSTPAAASAPASGAPDELQACGGGEGAGAVLLRVVDLLGAVCACCADDAASCETLVRLADSAVLPAAAAAWRQAAAAHSAHDAAAFLGASLALQSRLLRARALPTGTRRDFGVRLVRRALPMLRAAASLWATNDEGDADATAQPMHGTWNDERRPAMSFTASDASRFVAALLASLGRLPAADERRGQHPMQVEAPPTSLHGCIERLASPTEPSAALGAIELLLLHLQLHLRGSSAAIEPPEAHAAFAALQQFVCRHAAAAEEEEEEEALPTPTLRRAALVWHRATLVSPHASSPRAGELLARRLLVAGPEEVARLPHSCVRWLWSYDSLRSEAAAMVLAWAVRRHPRPPRQLGALCRGDAHAASLLVQLLTSDLQQTRARQHGTHAILAVVRACIAPTARDEDTCDGVDDDDGEGEGGRSADAAADELLGDGSEGSASVGSGGGDSEVGCGVECSQGGADRHEAAGGSSPHPRAAAARHVLLAAGLAPALSKLCMLPASGAGRLAESCLLLELMASLMLPPPSHVASPGPHPPHPPHPPHALLQPHEAVGALHHAAALLLACAPGRAPLGGGDAAAEAAAAAAARVAADGAAPLQLASLNYINVVLLTYGARCEAGEAARADTLDALGDHTALVRHAAQLATADDDGATRPVAQAAAATMVAQLLDELPRLRNKPQLRATLQAALPLPALLAMGRHRSAALCALSLRMLAGLVTNGLVLQQTQTQQTPAASARLPPMPPPSPLQPLPPQSQRGSQQQQQRQQPGGAPRKATAADEGARVTSALLHASLRREVAVQAALACCTHALQQAAPARPLLVALAHQPWNAFALELAAKHPDAVGAAAACYWCSLLEQRPQWAAEMAERRPHATRQLAAAVVHAAPFTSHHARLLRVLLALRILGDALRPEAAAVLRHRLHTHPTPHPPQQQPPQPTSTPRRPAGLEPIFAADACTRPMQHSGHDHYDGGSEDGDGAVTLFAESVAQYDGVAPGVRSLVSEDTAGLLVPTWLLCRLPTRPADREEVEPLKAALAMLA